MTEQVLENKAEAPVKEKPKKMKKPRAGMVRARTPGAIIADIVLVFLVVFAAVICIVPMWHVLMLSLSDGFTVYNFEGLALIPQGGFTFNGYKELFEYGDGLIWKGYLNTVIYVVGTVGLGLVLNVLAGYALSRDSKLSGVFSGICVFTVIFTGGQAPLYWVVDSLGLTNTYFSVILTEATMGMYMIIGAMAFRSVPQSTVESAELEGAGHLRIMFQIMLPQCFSLFLVSVLCTFVAAWNSFVGAQLFNFGNNDLYPLQLILDSIKNQINSYLQGTGGASMFPLVTVQFAGIIMATLPIMILMPFFQNQIESGVIGGAVKG